MDLINSQIHELADLSVLYLDAGWDNVMFRLGEDYMIRLPRRSLGAELIRNEQLYLDYLPDQLPINIPKPIFIGRPQDNYPWHWSVLPFFKGEAADISALKSSEISRFIHFLKCIHIPANGIAPINTQRGVDFFDRVEDVEQRLLNVKDHLPDKYLPILRLWREALSADKNKYDIWLHGDLHPRNVLVENGKISAIIDWGDITSGDVATDLASIWMLFDDPSVRIRAIHDYEMDTNLLARTKGWVIYFASVFYLNGLADNSRHIKIGEQAFNRLLEDFG